MQGQRVCFPDDLKYILKLFLSARTPCTVLCKTLVCLISWLGSFGLHLLKQKFHLLITLLFHRIFFSVTITSRRIFPDF